jgi:hypothetical protein
MINFINTQELNKYIFKTEDKENKWARLVCPWN